MEIFFTRTRTIYIYYPLIHYTLKSGVYSLYCILFVPTTHTMYFYVDMYWGIVTISDVL